MQLPRVLSIVGLGIGLGLSLATPSATLAETPAGTVVRLPPLLVESSIGQLWLYCDAGGFEILSRCTKATTDRMVRAFVSANEGLDTLLPKQFRLRTDAPELLLFYDAALWPKARQDALAQMLLARAPLPQDSGSFNIEATTVFEPHRSDSRATSMRKNTASDREILMPTETKHFPSSENTRVGRYVFKGKVESDALKSAGSEDFFSNLRLTDADIMGTFAIVSGQDVDDSYSAVTYDAVAQVLTARVPKLPSWFITGFLSLYAHVRFDMKELVAPKINSSAVSELEQSLLPLRDFFSDASGAAKNPSLWLAQAELFVPWGLDPQEKRQEAFWRFVDRTSVKGETESAFAESFGFSFESAGKDLSRYLSAAKRANVRWPRKQNSDRAIELREASRNEIARIRGEWERLETRYVRKNLPTEELVYLAQARRTVGGAYARGDRDPRLVATFALLQLDAGDKSAAQPLLEEAACASVDRPRVYFELAKMRYDDALDRTRRNDGKIEGSELLGVVDLLASAAKRSPPLVGVYELLADVWANAAIEPDRAQLALVEEGLSVFATESPLHYRAAVLYKKLGNVSRADALADEALRDAQPRFASEIRQFREQLAGTAKK
jgi:hypothetical protein